jgi:protoporphyrinogen/coproporphyrinogen III oxidase
MPQYVIGHAERAAAIEAGIAELAGLEIAGNYLHGVGLADAIKSGRAAAQQVLKANA